MRRRLVQTVLAAWAAAPLPAFAQMALPGYTGLLNTPDAHVLGEGALELGANNALDPRFASQDISSPRNYVLNLGLYRGLEVGGRVAEYTNPAGAGLRDLSANFKWQLPLPWEHVPAIAVGVTDVAGGARNFHSTYLVATQRFGPLDLSLGGGTGQRLDGLFGGAALNLPWGFSVLADREPSRTAAGVRWKSPPIEWLAGTRIAVSALRQGSGDGAPARSEAQLSIAIPLGRPAASAPIWRVTPERDTGGFGASTATVQRSPAPSPTTAPSTATAQAVPVPPVAAAQPAALPTVPAASGKQAASSPNAATVGCETVSGAQGSKKTHPSSKGKKKSKKSSATKAQSSADRAKSGCPTVTQPGAGAASHATAPPAPVAARSPTPPGNVVSLDALRAAQAEVVAAERARHARAMQELVSLKARLAQAGLRDVYVGLRLKTLEVRCENFEFTRSDMDAVGLALGEAVSRAPEGIDRVAVTLARRGVPAWRVTVYVESWRRYLGTDAAPGGAPPAIDVTLGEDAPRETVWESATAAGPQPWVQLAVGPYLRTFVANEVGLLSYAWGLDVQPVVPLWRGGTFAMDYYVPAGNSTNFDDGYAFAPWRPRGGIQNAMVSHTAWVGSRWLMQTGVGRVQNEYDGLSHESMLWPTGDGDLSLRLRAGAFANATDRSVHREYVVGAARYYWSALDTFFEAGGGRYWQGDTGGSFEAKRWFGDVSVALYYQQTSAKVAGVRFSIPIAPGRSGIGDAVQFKIADRFDWGLGTRVGSPNTVTPDAGLIPTPTYNLQQSMLDNGRAAPGYLEMNAPRLREAWWRYRPKDK